MICVIDYGMGNLRSVSKALEKIGARVKVSSRSEDVREAEKLILPGVGAFGDGARELEKRALSGPIRAALREGKPFLGICLGMQLLFEESEESPGTPGLSFFRGKVQRFRQIQLKVPHMGWNDLKIKQPALRILNGVEGQTYFYFVHSYYPVPEDSTLIAATCDYSGEEFAALVGYDRVWASQFHPEKSQEAGLRVLENFISL